MFREPFRMTSVVKWAADCRLLSSLSLSGVVVVAEMISQKHSSGSFSSSAAKKTLKPKDGGLKCLFCLVCAEKKKGFDTHCVFKWASLLLIKVYMFTHFILWPLKGEFRTPCLDILISKWLKTICERLWSWLCCTSCTAGTSRPLSVTFQLTNRVESVREIHLAVQQSRSLHDLNHIMQFLFIFTPPPLSQYNLKLFIRHILD